jgi:integrase
MTEYTQKLKESPILTREELVKRITIDSITVRDRALIAFLYLSACRIEEVVRYVKTKNLRRVLRNKETKELESKPLEHTIKAGDPIKKSQIEIRPGTIIIVNDVRTLKRKKYYARKIPIPINDRERELVAMFIWYLKSLNEDEYLFDISRVRAWQILRSIDLHPHYLRHMRNTHLAIDYNMSSSQIQKLNGWGVSSTADVYVHLNIEDLIKHMVPQ